MQQYIQSATPEQIYSKMPAGSPNANKHELPPFFTSFCSSYQRKCHQILQLSHQGKMRFSV